MNDNTCSKHIPGGLSLTSGSLQQGKASQYSSHTLLPPFIPILYSLGGLCCPHGWAGALCIQRAAVINWYAPEVSPHKTLFQQIPYLLSRECLQQLKLLNALSLRLMAIIKAVLSSPLLFFAELLESGERGCASQQETMEIHVQQFSVYYFFGLLACPRCWMQIPSLQKPPGRGKNCPAIVGRVSTPPVLKKVHHYVL